MSLPVLEPNRPPPSLPTAGGWCGSARADPITGLVAFPDFHLAFPQYLTASLDRGVSVGLAIGDVDHLKAYVENANAADPESYGHLAGNALMADLGRSAATWFHQAGFERGCVSTFGGDEVIVAAETADAAHFRTCLTGLRDRFHAELPRTVSFALAVLAPPGEPRRAGPGRAHHLYLHLASSVDRALFARKAARTVWDEGFVIDVELSQLVDVLW